FDAARIAGFAGVEIQRLADGNPDDMACAATDAGVRVVLVNTGSGDYSLGGDGLSCVPGRESDFRAAVEYALAAAATMGALHVHLGPSRVPPEATRDECLRTYCANIRVALALSRAAKTS